MRGHIAALGREPGEGIGQGRGRGDRAPGAGYGAPGPGAGAGPGNALGAPWGPNGAGARGRTGGGEIAPQGPDIAQGGAVRAAVLYLRALGQTLRLPALVEAGDAIGRGDHLRWAEARRAELEED